jgi:hypothetical protein
VIKNSWAFTREKVRENSTARFVRIDHAKGSLK